MGRKVSQKIREKHSKAHKGRTPVNNGRKMPQKGKATRKEKKKRK